MAQCTFSFSTNLEYLLTRPGLLKVMTLVFGLFSMAIGIHGVEDSQYNNVVGESLENEEYFVSAVSVSFIISIFYLIIHSFSDELTNNKINRIIDTIYHGVAGKALLVGGMLLIVSAMHIQSLAVCRTFPLFMPAAEGKKAECQLHRYKVVGGALAMFNAVLYEVAAYFIYTTKELP